MKIVLLLQTNIRFICNPMPQGVIQVAHCEAERGQQISLSLSLFGVSELLRKSEPQARLTFEE
jgi:hypothetical protein